MTDASNRAITNRTLSRRQFLLRSGVIGVSLSLPGVGRATGTNSAEYKTEAAEYKNVFSRPMRDLSGLATTVVYGREAISPHERYIDFPIAVPPDMVAIGGGVTAVEGAAGVLLTASYPNKDLSAWMVSAKDHRDPQPYYLDGYAIGLKVNGMSRAELLRCISVVTADSPVDPHPEATAELPDGFVLVSGGFNVFWQGAGNLATASFPSDTWKWTARSKDHEDPGPASIRSYAIGLRQQLPVGKVTVVAAEKTSPVAAHPTATALLPENYALTGVGAEVHWQGDGNLLWQLRPEISATAIGAIASSKDHDVSDPSALTVYALGMSIQSSVTQPSVKQSPSAALQKATH